MPDSPPTSGLATLAPLLQDVITRSLEFKDSEDVFAQRATPHTLRDLLLEDLPEQSATASEIWEDITQRLLPYCVNMNSPRFMGFGDTGADPASVVAGVFAVLAQQNLINQSFCSPSGTMAEIAVIRWLRDLIGYPTLPASDVASVWEAGGITTYGGTGSNTTAMMLAREHAVPGTLTDGVRDPDRFGLVVPRGVGHYSVKSAAAWTGCGTHLVEVETDRFRYDLDALARAVKENAGRLMAVVAYAGDSRTQTIDHLRAVHDTVRSADPTVWLHVDACWGLMAAFTERRKHLLDGIDAFDSVTVDPHKVLNIPYAMSALLLRDPADLRMVSSYSDLIMQEDYAFGQVTPQLGTKEWASLRAWAALRSQGRQGLTRMMDERLDRTETFTKVVDASSRLVRVHNPDLTAVAFCYLPRDIHPGRASEADVERLNEVNRAIHRRLMDEGRWHLHQFTIPDDYGHIRRGAVLAPLRFMSINPRITNGHMAEVLDYVTRLGEEASR
jgi:L-2,4-diaminobutyrate decarboxylase